MVEGAAAVKNSLKMSSLFKLSETPIAGIGGWSGTAKLLSPLTAV